MQENIKILHTTQSPPPSLESVIDVMSRNASGVFLAPVDDEGCGFMLIHNGTSMLIDPDSAIMLASTILQVARKLDPIHTEDLVRNAYDAMTGPPD